MQGITLRSATPEDFESICSLNSAAVQHTSAMDLARLTALDGLSCYHQVACVDGRVAAFLLAMRNDAAYDSENFAWFARRYPRFVYVDRIVVAAPFRGLHLASLLYQDLFRYARMNGIPWLACEYNLVPANEPSRLFHAKFGFREQGTQWVANGSRQVSLQMAPT
jgi:predicted GNAT superfamily acetyltransferase